MVEPVLAVLSFGRAQVELVLVPAVVLVVLGLTAQRIQTAIPEMHPVVGEEEDENRGIPVLVDLVVQVVPGKS
jgi:hypothetical protein